MMVNWLFVLVCVVFEDEFFVLLCFDIVGSGGWLVFFCGWGEGVVFV